MARFKKFFQRIPHGSYDELLVGELQSDSRVKDPEVKLRVDYVAKSHSTNLRFSHEKPIIVTSLVNLDNLVVEMMKYKAMKNIEREAKKIAKS